MYRSAPAHIQFSPAAEFCSYTLALNVCPFSANENAGSCNLQEWTDMAHLQLHFSVYAFPFSHEQLLLQSLYLSIACLDLKERQTRHKHSAACTESSKSQ
jgi:hypothetical protein